MKSRLLHYDTLDDRRELVRLLAELRPADRWRFVGWMCASCRGVGRNGKRPELFLDAGDRERLKLATRIGDPVADRSITHSAYAYCLALATQYGLDLDDAACILEALVKGRTTFGAMEHTLCASRAATTTGAKSSPSSTSPGRLLGSSSSPTERPRLISPHGHPA